MTKPKALVLAGFTAWPIVYIFVAIFLFLAFIVTTEVGPHEPTHGIPTALVILMALHIFTILLVFILIAIYIVHIFRTDAVSQDKKALWAVVIFLGHVFAMPVYWYLYIWKKLE
jgi:hypothetical protein